MSEVKFEIETDRGEIPARKFRDAIYYSVSLLREFDAAISGNRRGVLQWYVGHLKSNGNLSLTFRSMVRIRPNVQKHPTDVAPDVTASFLAGFQDIEQKCVIPEYLSEYGLTRVGELAHLIGDDGPKGFRFQSGDKSTEVTTKTSDNVRKLLPIQRTSIGSVEGRLETVNLHRKPRFIVYHAVTHRAITCEFNPDKFMQRVRECLGERVSVFGTLHKNINGETLRITMQELKILDESKRFVLPGDARDLEEPEFTKARNTEEYLRNIRGR